MAVFAQGPIGLRATAGAKLMGASRIIAVDAVPARMEMARRLGADEVVSYLDADPVEAIRELTGGRGVDVAIEAVGTQGTFENALRVLASGRLDLRPLVTHRFTLDRIDDAYDLFANQRDGVLKVAITT